jgi:hypothetical protein
VMSWATKQVSARASAVAFSGHVILSPLSVRCLNSGIVQRCAFRVAEKSRVLSATMAKVDSCAAAFGGPEFPDRETPLPGRLGRNDMGVDPTSVNGRTGNSGPLID